MPRNSANTITASMSPSAIALTTLLGTSWTRKSTPVAPAPGACAGATARADSLARSSGERPSPGRTTLTSATPMPTAMLETTTV